MPSFWVGRIEECACRMAIWPNCALRGTGHAVVAKEAQAQNYPGLRLRNGSVIGGA